MSNIIELTGRGNELSIIEKIIYETQKKHVVVIEGEGGIGKTRLIHEINSRLFRQGTSQLSFTHVIDFDEPSLNFTNKFEYRLAGELGTSVLESYLKELRDYRRMEFAEISLENLEKMQLKATDTLIEKINEKSRQKRVIVFFDTLDKLEDTKTIDYIKNLIVKSLNVVYILGGKEQGGRWRSFLQNLTDSEFTIIKLLPLQNNDVELYLHRKEQQLHNTFDPELAKKILLLAGGRPILIDLAIEYLSLNTLPPPWLPKGDFTLISKKDREKLIEDFEYNLVFPITQIRSNLDRLTLLMSRVYPINTEMISKLFDLSESEATELFDEAKTHVFVKPIQNSDEISLHDEMRRMIHTHIWNRDIIDSDGERRRKDSFKASIYFMKKDATFLEAKEFIKIKSKQNLEFDMEAFRQREEIGNQRDTNTEQWIYHALYANIHEGFNVWENIVNKIRTKAKRYFFAENLTKIAQQFYADFDEDEKIRFDIFDARLLIDIGKINEGKSKLLYLLDRNNEAYKSKIYNALGVVELKSGNLDKALEYQLNCFEIINDDNKDASPPVANQIGFIYRLRSDLNKATEYYNLALEIEDNKENPNKDLVASVLNNLGYVYGLRKDYDNAYNFCKRALKKWVDNGSKRESARAEVSMAILNRDQRDYNNSLRLLDSALAKCQDPDDHATLCQANFHKGWALFYQAEEIVVKVGEISELKWNENLMNNALTAFSISTKFAENFGHKADLPGIYLLTATVKWYLGGQTSNSILRQEARQMMDKAYNTSLEVGYLRYIVHSLVRKAEFDYEEEIFDLIPKYTKELFEVYGDKKEKFPLYFGRMIRIEADVFFKNKEYENAVQKYAESIPLIKQHGGFGRYSFARELERFEAKLSNLPVTTSREILLNLRDIWLSKNIEVLVNWCNLQLT